eukprot:TRINITY_DN14643_c0_g1_i3.p1 TRINITY_DN14643_c0_g1~~TRINITY_DN14643_c0_g1_i3.p1  ORF type:complete len:426 (-),score=51.82 TRINITY_DN14643_c0_g1_i3:27-1304(-)
MPLNALWGFNALVHLDHVGLVLHIAWTIGAICWAGTTGFCLAWVFRDIFAIQKYLEKAERPMAAWHNQLATVIVTMPFFIAQLGLIGLVIPAMIAVLEMNIAILASVNVICTAQYLMLGLGEPPAPKNFLEKAGEKKWWCHSWCGGVNDTMAGIGLFKSRKAHLLTLDDLRCALTMVKWFLFLYIASNCVSNGIAMAPTPIYQSEGGWCVGENAFPVVSACSIVVAVASSFVGLSGFSIISAAVHAAEKAYSDKPFHHGANLRLYSKEKACNTNIMMILPLLLPVLGSLPIHFNIPQIPVLITEHADVQKDGNWSTSGRTIMCPVYDQQVCGHMLFVVFVLIFMFYISFNNWRYFAPGDQSAIDFPRRCTMELEDEDEGSEGGSSDTDEDSVDLDADHVDAEAANGHRASGDKSHSPLTANLRSL